MIINNNNNNDNNHRQYLHKKQKNHKNLRTPLHLFLLNIIIITTIAMKISKI
jgi:hypothetical protein